VPPSPSAEALNELTAKFPDLSRHVRDDQGQIRQFLNIYSMRKTFAFWVANPAPLRTATVFCSSLPLPVAAPIRQPARIETEHLPPVA